METKLFASIVCYAAVHITIQFVISVHTTPASNRLDRHLFKMQ